MKKSILILTVVVLVSPLISYAHTACETGDLFNIDTGARCVPLPCQNGDLYNSQTGQLCSTLGTVSLPTTSTIEPNSECMTATNIYNEDVQQYLDAQSTFNQQYNNVMNAVGGTSGSKAQEINALEQQNGYTITSLSIKRDSAQIAKNNACNQ